MTCRARGAGRVNRIRHRMPVWIICAGLCVCFASSAHAEDRLYRLSLASAVAAHGADLATTEFCLGQRTCRETNPWLLKFSTQPAVFGASKMAVASLGLWATSKLHPAHPRWAQFLNWTVSGAYTAIAIRNTRVGQ